MPKPRYYVRMNIAGRWFFLWKIKYQKIQHSTKPIWQDEMMLGKQEPYLYSTLVYARNALDRYVSARARQAEVAVWRERAVCG